ncbi:MAG: DUF559 domain-containing protein [Solirubrobacterales bacterium]|nr:DUF559 domain-containing protein [Solirubrobacterales bacterium]
MGHVESHKAPAGGAHCAYAHENRAESIEAPLRGPLCAFEHPRTTGETEFAWLAARQERCLHRRQLLAGGLARGPIATRIRRGTLTRLLSDVYLYGHATPNSLAMAIALHLRGYGVLSWEFAAWLWGLADHRPDKVTATVAGRFARSPHPDITLHRVTALDKTDVRWRKGLPVTAPARTLIDYAASADPLETESALAKLRYHNLDRQLEPALTRVPANHAGAPVIRELLNKPPGQLSRTKSAYERKLRSLIQQAGLAPPLSNHGIQGVESDLVWPAHKLIVEFDGWEFHKDRIHADKARDAALIAAGWRIMRITADRVDHEPYKVIAQITQALSAGE